MLAAMTNIIPFIAKRHFLGETKPTDMLLTMQVELAK